MNKEYKQLDIIPMPSFIRNMSYSHSSVGMSLIKWDYSKEIKGDNRKQGHCASYRSIVDKVWAWERPEGNGAKCTEVQWVQGKGTEMGVNEIGSDVPYRGWGLGVWNWGWMKLGWCAVQGLRAGSMELGLIEIGSDVPYGLRAGSMELGLIEIRGDVQYRGWGLGVEYWAKWNWKWSTVHDLGASIAVEWCAIFGRA